MKTSGRNGMRRWHSTRDGNVGKAPTLQAPSWSSTRRFLPTSHRCINPSTTHTRLSPLSFPSYRQVVVHSRAHARAINASFQVRDQIASRVLEDAEERVAIVHILADAGLSAARILELGETLRNMPFTDDR
jgi:hypothetical protein